jgi:RNA polymerase sigma factor (sigma-70 family)
MAGRFTTTSWSLVFAAGHTGPQSDAALASLCETYWHPVYAYLRRAGHNMADAQDLTQAFFARLLEKHWLEAATPDRGRFRSFLLASLKHFVANERDRGQALKRGGGLSPPVPLESLEERYRLEPRDDSTPETIYDRQWALTVFDRAAGRLHHELAKAGKSSLFEVLKSYVTDDDETERYRETAARLGMSEGAVKVTVHRLRRRFRDLVREEVAGSVRTPDEIDDEVRHLKTALGG